MLTIGRWGLRVPEGTDGPADVPFWLERLATDLSGVSMDDQGTLAARPVSTVGAPSNKPGRYWYVTGDSDATQNGRLWRDTGAGWVEVAMNRRPVLTALPGSATTGDEILFQTAGMAAVGWGPWTLRYDSSLSGTSKWKVLAADVRYVSAETNGVSGGTGGYVDFTDALPTIALPVVGDYEGEFGASPFHNTTGGQISTVPVATGLSADSANEIIFRSPGANSCTASMSRRVALLGVSGTLKLQFTQTVTGGNLSHRWLAARPLRIG